MEILYVFEEAATIFTVYHYNAISSAFCDVVFFIVGKYDIEMFEQKLLHLPQFSSNKTVKKRIQIWLSLIKLFGGWDEFAILVHADPKAERI